jgi:hypothetical protein
MPVNIPTVSHQVPFGVKMGLYIRCGAPVNNFYRSSAAIASSHSRIITGIVGLSFPLLLVIQIMLVKNDYLKYCCNSKSI